MSSGARSRKKLRAGKSDIKEMPKAIQRYRENSLDTCMKKLDKEPEVINDGWSQQFDESRASRLAHPPTPLRRRHWISNEKSNGATSHGSIGPSFEGLKICGPRT